MKQILFDLETKLIEDGPTLPSIHCCVYTYDGKVFHNIVGAAEVLAFWKGILAGPDELLLVGHNIAQFDIPVLEQALGARITCEMYDTLVASRMTHTQTIVARSAAMRGASGDSEVERQAAFPKKHLRSHSLEAWGYRFRQLKKHTDVDKAFWHAFSPEMLERCESDVTLNWRLYQWLQRNGAKPGWPAPREDVVRFESRVSYILGHQRRHGIGFNVEAAQVLEHELACQRVELAQKLTATFGGWYAPRTGQKESVSYECEYLPHPDLDRQPGEAFFTVPKRVITRKPNTKLHPHPWPAVFGGPHTKIAWVEFNAGSDQHIAEGLKRRHGWVPDPEEYTDGGQPETSERVLKKLDYPEVEDLLAHKRCQKQLGQLSEGTNAWLKLHLGGIIYGSVNVVGTRTMRMTHARPNVAQVDRDPRMRELFRPTRRRFWAAKQLGVDASGLELRCLAHRLAPWDGGATAEHILKGDVHSEWMKFTQLHSRDHQKTFTYAMLYGAGPEKLGQTVISDALDAGEHIDPRFAIELGKTAKDKLMRGLPALDYLLDKLAVAYERGYIKGIDGHIIVCNSAHGVLNDLLQSDGGIVMKHALRRLWSTMGDTHGKTWGFMANVHDEWQMEVANETEARKLGEFAVKCIANAGHDLGFRCPLDGEYKIGDTWRETH